MFVRLLYLLLYIISLAFSKIEIRDANVAALSRDDIGMIFYITILNSDIHGYEIKVKMLQCTEVLDGKDKDSGFMYLLGGHMGFLKSRCYKNVTLLYPNLYLHNRKGYCIISLKFKSDNDRIVQKRANISFDTTITRKYTPTILRGYYYKSEIHKCETIDLDPLNRCKKVDCHQKYLGTRNYYSNKWKRCQKVPICIADATKDMPDVIYTPLNNKCRDMEKSVTKQDLTQLESGIKENEHSKCEDNYRSLINIDCHYGRYNNESGICSCDEGWTSSQTDKDQSDPTLFVFHMCNIEISGMYDTSSTKLKIISLIIGILAVVIAMFMIILSFILHQAYECIKRFEDKDDKDEKSPKKAKTNKEKKPKKAESGKSSSDGRSTPKSQKSTKTSKKTTTSATTSEYE